MVQGKISYWLFQYEWKQHVKYLTNTLLRDTFHWLEFRGVCYDRENVLLHKRKIIRSIMVYKEPWPDRLTCGPEGTDGGRSESLKKPGKPQVSDFRYGRKPKKYTRRPGDTVTRSSWCHPFSLVLWTSGIYSKTMMNMEVCETQRWTLIRYVDVLRYTDVSDVHWRILTYDDS